MYTDPQAAAVQAYLDYHDVARNAIAAAAKSKRGRLATAQPFVFYNCREKWAGLLISTPGDTEQLAIIFGENRNSDNLCVAAWRLPWDNNPPTHDEYTEAAHLGRKYLDPYAVNEAVGIIEAAIENHIGGI